MKIEVGKYYRTRNGRKVGPMAGVNFKWVRGKDSGLDPEWNNDGTCREGFTTYDDELIAEWTDTPKTWGEMTNAEKGALLLARHEGKEIEFASIFELEWRTVNNPMWADVYAYRIKPKQQRETVTLYGYVQIDGNGAQFDNCWGPSSTNTHRLTFTTTDGKPATGTFTNENGDVIIMEEM
jgi:hypothetical protein